MAAARASVQNRVAHLQETLRTAKGFLVPWSEFHDDLAMDSEFMSLGRPAKSPFLDQAIEQITASQGRRLRGQARTIHIPELGLWHGFFMLDKGVGVFFYYEDHCQGLLGLMTDLTGPVDLFRLSTIAVPTV